MEPLTNAQKYANYKTQMGRLERAIKEHFLLEALFIEYAIMEDRAESILLHAGRTVGPREGLVQKLKDIAKQLPKNELLARYVKPELLDEIEAWSKKRNDYIHSLMKQVFTGGQLEDIVEQGKAVIKTLTAKSTGFKRALERKAASEEKTASQQQ